MKKMWWVIVSVLVFCKYSYASWNISTIDTTGDVGKYASCVMLCTPCVSYYDSTNGNLKFATTECGPITFSTIFVDTTGDVGKFTSIEVWKDSSSGKTRILISYYDVTNGNLKIACSKFSSLDSFDLFTIDSVGNVGLFTSIYVDTSQKRPYISYYDETNKDLKLAYFKDTTWIIQKIDTAGDVGQYNSIWGFDDAVYINYYDATNGDLKLARYYGSSWQIENIDTAGDVGQYTSMSDFRVSYYDSKNGDLKIADWYQNNWHIQKIDTAEDVGLFSSISRNIPYNLYYYDKTNGNLKISYGEIIDSAGDVGGYCANADGTEVSFVVYYDFTNGDLKKAWVGGAVEEGNKQSLNNISIAVTPTLARKNICISYCIPSSYANLKVFNVTGRLVKTLLNKELNSGSHTIQWNGEDEQGNRVNSGVYFVRLKSGEAEVTKKFLFLK